MSNQSDSNIPVPKWKAEEQRKLYRRGPFKLKLGNKTFKFRYAEGFSDAMTILSHRRFSDVGQMVDAIKELPNGY